MKYDFNIKDCNLLGSGHEGSVYLTPEGYALKVFKNTSSAKEEERILKKAEDSVFFPKVIKREGNKILREYVAGENLYQYIKEHGLSFKVSTEIINLIEDFKILKFKRINIRNAHIFINSKEKLMVIDPRKTFTMSTPYPKDIIRILLDLKVFEKFLTDLLEYRPDLIYFWIDGYNYTSSLRIINFYRLMKKHRRKY